MRPVLVGAVAAVLLLAGGATGATARPAPQATSAGTGCHLAGAQGVDKGHLYIGNISDLSGPVPGLDSSAQDAVKAFVAYSDAAGTVCGRKLALRSYDSRDDAGADQEASVSACKQTFALVGSVSSEDSGGAATTQACGEPDLRASINTPQRRACRTCFALHSDSGKAFYNAVPALLERTYGGGQHAALLYLDSGDNAEIASVMTKVGTERGLHYDVVDAISTTEFNYAPYVTMLRTRGVETVQYLPGDDPRAITRFVTAMKQGGYHPEVFMPTVSAYTSSYDDGGIPTVVALDTQPFEAPKPTAELNLYRHWLHVVDPGAAPTVEGIYAWSAARLFVDRVTALGDKLTRASLVAALRKVDDWKDGGIHAAQHVGARQLGGCVRFVRHSGSTWVPVDGRSLHCNGVTTV